MPPKLTELVAVASRSRFRRKMFNWFKKKKEVHFNPEVQEEHLDEMEKCLWDIKEEYDLPTEEIIEVVQSKRKNLEYMHKIISQKFKERT